MNNQNIKMINPYSLNLNEIKHLNDVKNLTNEEKLLMDYNINFIFENTFSCLRKILNDQTSLLKKINKNYEDTLKSYLTSYVGYEYYHIIFKIYECVVDIISCVDLYRLTTIILKYDITPFEQINTKQIIFENINKIKLEVQEKAFIKNLIEAKLNVIFECIDFIMKNPKLILKAIQCLSMEQEDIF